MANKKITMSLNKEAYTEIDQATGMIVSPDLSYDIVGSDKRPSKKAAKKEVVKSEPPVEPRKSDEATKSENSGERYKPPQNRGRGRGETEGFRGRGGGRGGFRGHDSSYKGDRRDWKKPDFNPARPDNRQNDQHGKEQKQNAKVEELSTSEVLFSGCRVVQNTLITFVTQISFFVSMLQKYGNEVSDLPLFDKPGGWYCVGIGAGDYAVGGARGIDLRHKMDYKCRDGMSGFTNTNSSLMLFNSATRVNILPLRSTLHRWMALNHADVCVISDSRYNPKIDLFNPNALMSLDCSDQILKLETGGKDPFYLIYMSHLGVKPFVRLSKFQPTNKIRPIVTYDAKVSGNIIVNGMLKIDHQNTRIIPSSGEMYYIGDNEFGEVEHMLALGIELYAAKGKISWASF